MLKMWIHLVRNIKKEEFNCVMMKILNYSKISDLENYDNKEI
jgi:hypothetical protein